MSPSNSPYYLNLTRNLPKGIDYEQFYPCY
jgi:hypothetical protein